MRDLLRRLGLGICAWLGCLGVVYAAPPQAHAAEAAAGAGHQVLVMLRLAPEHIRPGGNYADAYSDGLGRSERRRVASKIARDNGLVLVSGWPMRLLGVDCYVMATPMDQSPAAVADKLSHVPGVVWSQPMNTYRSQGDPGAPNDPLYPVQPAAREWRLTALHQIATGRHVRVAVVDSMIQGDHPDLIGQVEVEKNFVEGRRDAPERHGTGVAGVIAARANNGVGVVGVAPGARLMALRACWQEASPGDAAAAICDSLSLAKALDFAIDNKAQVINLSLSGPPDRLLGRLIDVALSSGEVVVAAYDRKLPHGGFPASVSGVVAVLDDGPGPSPVGVVDAPGRDVPTTQPGGTWGFVNGSSYAAAHVSGLFALLRERSQASHDVSALVTIGTQGAIDACATLLRVAGPCRCACAERAGAK